MAREWGFTPLTFWGHRPPGAALTDIDRLLIRALRIHEAGICAGCGHHRDETMDPAHDIADPDHVAHYEAGAPWECLACTALARSQARWAKSYEAHDLAGLQWSVSLVPNPRHRLHTPLPTP